MDPIEYLRLYMTMWEQWLNKYETYKYHGEILRCKKGIALIPIYKGFLYEKHPPIYYQYNYTGEETFGFVKFYLYESRDVMLVMGSNSLTFRSWGSRQPYDILYCQIKMPRCDGSFSFTAQLEDISCGVFETKDYTKNWIEVGSAIQNPFGTLNNIYSRYGYCPYPYYFDYWWWRKLPNWWSLFYTFNWRYYPISGKYDYWDNLGHVAIGKSVSGFLIGTGGWYIKSYVDTKPKCYTYLGVNYSGLTVYSGIYTPLP